MACLYLRMPPRLAPLVRGQLFAHYPDVAIDQVAADLFLLPPGLVRFD